MSAPVSTTPPSTSQDLERGDNTDFLRNTVVGDFSWQGLTVTVKDRETKDSRDLINGVSGDVRQGMCFFLLFFLAFFRCCFFSRAGVNGL